MSQIGGANSALDIELEQNEIIILEKAARDAGVVIKGFWEKGI